MNFCTMLGQSHAWTSADQKNILIALSILLLLVIVGGVGLLIFRRKWNAQQDQDNSANVGFSLSDLREMRDRGEITNEEYETTRQRVISKVRSSLAGPNKKNPNGPGGQGGAGGTGLGGGKF